MATKLNFPNLMKRPRKFAGKRRPFDIAACQDAELCRLLVDVPIEQGWPYTAGVFVWAMVNKEFNTLARERINPMLEDMQCAFEAWRRARLMHVQSIETLRYISGEEELLSAQAKKSERFQEIENTKVLFISSIAKLVSDKNAELMFKFVASNYAENLLSRVDAPLSSVFTWEFSWTVLAHVARQRCMACSGIEVRCAHRCNGLPSASSSIDAVWQFPVGQAQQIMYAKRRCIELQCVQVLSGDPFALPKNAVITRNSKEERRFHAIVGAKAMLHQKGIYEMRSLPALRLLRGCDFHLWARNPKPNWELARNNPLFLCHNKHVPTEHTLEGRLGLTPEEVAASTAERDRVLCMHAQQEQAVRDVRLKKFRGDVDIFLARELNGETLKTLRANFPTLDASVERLLRLADAAEETTPRFHGSPVDALEMQYVRAYLQRVVQVIKFVAPVELQLMGDDNTHSSEAFEYLFNLTTGAFPGDSGPWRANIDRDLHQAPFGCDAWVMGQQTAYCVAAMHIFDKIATSEWTFTFEHASRLDKHGNPIELEIFWWLRCEEKNITLRSPINRGRVGDFSYIKEWHAMVTSYFEAQSKVKDFAEVIPVLPRTTLSSSTWKRGWPVLSVDWPGSKGVFGAKKECEAYLTEMCGTCSLFPSTRHAALLLASIEPTDLLRVLVKYHKNWASGLLDRTDPCPSTPTDFALWLTDNPQRLPILRREVDKSAGEKRSLAFSFRDESSCLLKRRRKQPASAAGSQDGPRNEGRSNEVIVPETDFENDDDWQEQAAVVQSRFEPREDSDDPIENSDEE